jgi:thiamine biosynthesis lipoprotein
MSAPGATRAARAEAQTTFRCFGATCSVLVSGAGAAGSAPAAVAMARRALLSAHRRFTRFAPDSELSALNADPRDAVPVSPLMGRLVDAVVAAREQTGGLVDATLLHELEDAGYRGDLRHPLPAALALRLAPPRRPAAPRPRRDLLAYDAAAGLVRREPGLGIDSGGLVKGLLADMLAERLGGHAAFAVDCAGDLRLGGEGGVARRVEVASPFDGGVLHAFAVAAGGVATSGIGRRSWLDERGAPAHHLLDPATGRPAFTGVVQATALAPTALEAEIRAKAAVLSGPQAAAAWLPGGGVVVLEDGTHRVLPARDAGAR